MSERQNGAARLCRRAGRHSLHLTCCLGPLVLVALGFSGAWIGNLTVLEPYRPLFIGAALVALFFAWKRIYRPVQACKPGEVCAIAGARHLQADFLDRGRAGPGRAWISLCRSIFLLTVSASS